MEEDDSGLDFEDMLPSLGAGNSINKAQENTRRNFIHKGDRLNLTQMDPTIRRLEFGFGWDVTGFGDDKGADLDASLFLLNKHNLTREDDDFVFYNNLEGCNGAVKHLSDSRTGAGVGDDEKITLALDDIPFDVFKIEVVVSIYNGDELERSFKEDVRNTYVRLQNLDSERELFRYDLDKEFEINPDATVIKIGFLERMGPEWHFEAEGISMRGGLAKVATEYGIIIKAVLSSRDNEIGPKAEEADDS